MSHDNSSLWAKSYGLYNPGTDYLGIDYRTLFLDPEFAYSVIAHESVHSVLSETTEFGDATKQVLRLLPQMAHLNETSKEIIGRLIVNSQRNTQEGIATLMQVLVLKNRIGSLNQARAIIAGKTDNYYRERLEEVSYTFDFSKKWRGYFTSKVPDLALRTGFRRDCVSLDLLRNPEMLQDYLKAKDNNPDERYRRLVDKLREKNYLITRDSEFICENAGIELVSDITKTECADFLNYLISFTNRSDHYTAEDIGDEKTTTEALSESTNKIIIHNINLNLTENAIPVWDTGEFITETRDAEAIFILRLDTDSDLRKEITQLTGTIPEIGLIAFTPSGEKYYTSLDENVVTDLLGKRFKNITLMIKPNLYIPNKSTLPFPGCTRNAEVVIYNSLEEFQETMHDYLVNDGKIDCVYFGASEGHPFQTFLAKDAKGVLHLINVIGDKTIALFIETYSGSIASRGWESFKRDSQSINNALSTWMGLPWEADWYSTILDGKKFHYRTYS